MGGLISNLVKFVGQVSKGKDASGSFGKTLSGLLGVFKGLGIGIAAVAGAIAGGLISAFSQALGSLKNMWDNAIGFNMSLTGMLEEAEKARAYFSELADSMNFYSSSTGSTTKAVSMLTTATGQSKASLETLKGAFGSLVDAGVDSDKFIEDMLPTLGDFEVKTGVAASQWAMFSGKLQQSLSDKKGITNDIKNLQKALIGTGLKGAQLESTLQGLTEATEKLAFVTNGASLDIKKLSDSYGSTVATFKAFGISAQTTTNFLNGMIDPENVEKNMLLMNKMGISYQEYNDMLNSGKGQDKFFDKILSNVGKVAQEANMIQDASSRFKYLKDTLGLPPEIANKLMKVTPSKMQAELKKIKKEMAEAEKKDKWKKDLKAREEKYEEQMRFLRMQMVAPLIAIVQKNRNAIMNFMKAMKPVFTFISEKLAQLLGPMVTWVEKFAAEIESVTNGGGDVWATIKKGMFDAFSSVVSGISDMFSALWNDPRVKKFFEDTFGDFWEKLKAGLLIGLGAALLIAFSPITAPFILMATAIGGLIAAFGGFKFWEAFGADIKKGFNTLAEWLEPVWRGLKKLGEIIWMIMKPILIVVGAIQALMAGTLLAIVFGPFIAAIALFRKAVTFFGGESKDNEKADELLKDNKMNSNSAAAADGFAQSAKVLADSNKINISQGIGGAQTQIDDLVDAMKSGDEEKYKNNLSELRTELLKDKKNSEGDVDKYLASLVSMSHTKQQVQDAATTVQGTTEGVAKEIEKNKEALEQTKALTNEKLSDAEVAAATQKLMADPAFMSAISSSIVSNKDKRINELTTQVTSLESQSKALRDEFEKLKTESVPGILKQWEQFLFGEKEGSFKLLLTNIRDYAKEDLDMQKKKEKGGKPGGPVKNTDITNFNDIAKTGSSITSARSKLINDATGPGVKNIQVKQTLFLKSIADSTYDSAAILKYIGRNLNFTQHGLAVYSSSTDDKYERYSFKGELTKSEDGGNIYGI